MNFLYISLFAILIGQNFRKRQNKIKISIALVRQADFRFEFRLELTKIDLFKAFEYFYNSFVNHNDMRLGCLGLN